MKKGTIVLTERHLSGRGAERDAIRQVLSAWLARVLSGRGSREV